MQKVTTEIAHEMHQCSYSGASPAGAHFRACTWIQCTETGTGIGLPSNPGLPPAATNACAYHWSHASTQANRSYGAKL